MADKGSNSITMNLHGVDGMLMGIDISAYASNDSQYRIVLFDTNIHKHVYEGNLQETIELILLGKLHKAQLQAESNKESVSASEIRELQNNG